MKAAVYERYGPPGVLQLMEVPAPAVGDHEVLIKLRASTVTSGDARLRAMKMPAGFGLLSRLIFGVRGPRRKVLGMEFAGVISAAGKQVTRFKEGDAVFGMAGVGMGCHAELRALPEDGAIVMKPANLSFEEAAAMSFGGTTSLEYFRRAKLAPGERMLIHGASGAVGTAAVQLAKHFGAHVTAVCSTANVGLVQSLGADVVIDYTREDFALNGQRYDLIMDTVGTVPFSRWRGSLAARGRLLLVAAALPDMLRALWVNLTTSTRVIVGPASERAEDLRLLAELAEQGRYRPVIDRSYPLEQIAEAHARVDGGHKRGNVVISLLAPPPGVSSQQA